MAFLKQIGPMEISEAGGVASVSISLSEALGGGSMAGVVKASLVAKAEVSAVQLMDAGLLLLAGKFPAFAAEIGALKALVDAELAKA